MTPNALDTLVGAHHQGPNRPGLTSVCSAHPTVLEASLRHALTGGETILIESTCNQVNQYGGYTGLKPADFKALIDRLIDRVGIPPEQVILGGDHLGPSVWQNEPAAQAMDKARVLVRDKVLAGYLKIHLDASMRCADDPPDRPLDPAVSAARSADLALIAEQAHAQRDPSYPSPRYVIGTEVPPPGGIQGEEGDLRVTPPDEVEDTIALTRQAFIERGLEAAWERVIAVVVQPGVEYGDQVIYDYHRSAAASLSRYIEGIPTLVYEAHSTDYQTRQALRHLVEDHFAILKVGPALTFAYREAIDALSCIEADWLGVRGDRAPSGVLAALDSAMTADPRYWAGYYTGSAAEQAFARRFSLSDRSRYYWPVPEVQTAVRQLLDNLRAAPIPLPLLSQYFPAPYQRIREGSLSADPLSLVHDRIIGVLADYSYACRGASQG